jgi:hypothetical protein
MSTNTHCEIWNLIEMNSLPKSVHDFSKFYRVPVIFGQVLFQEEENE